MGLSIYATIPKGRLAMLVGIAGDNAADWLIPAEGLDKSASWVDSASICVCNAVGSKVVAAGAADSASICDCNPVGSKAVAAKSA